MVADSHQRFAPVQTGLLNRFTHPPIVICIDSFDKSASIERADQFSAFLLFDGPRYERAAASDRFSYRVIDVAKWHSSSAGLAASIPKYIGALYRGTESPRMTMGSTGLSTSFTPVSLASATVRSNIMAL